MIRLVLIGAALAAANASAAGAQTADFRALMERTNASVKVPPKDLLQSEALSIAREIGKAQGTCVPKGIEIGIPTPVTSDRVAVGGITAGQLLNAWTFYGRAKGCPASSPSRFVVFMTPNQLIVRKVNEGVSLANPSLMRDASASAALAAFQTIRSTNSLCGTDGMQMLGTEVTSKSHDLGPDFYGSYYTGSWAETWTFRVCSKRVAVPVNFRADGEGGAYIDIRSAEAKLLD